MPLLTGQTVTGQLTRTYTVQVPDNPCTAMVPTIIVFHGGGQDAATIAARWGVDPPNALPRDLADYLLVFPESDPRMGEEWVHFQAGDSKFPTLDLDFVRELLARAQYPSVRHRVRDDPGGLRGPGPDLRGRLLQRRRDGVATAEFGSWRSAFVGSRRSARRWIRRRFSTTGVNWRLPVNAIAPAAVAYIHGTADSGFRPPFTIQETDIGTTLPAFTRAEMLDRNGIPRNAVADSQLVPGSTGVTEVVVQVFEGDAAFLMATVINGGHNWPTPTTVGNPPVATHFDATRDDRPVLAAIRRPTGLTRGGPSRRLSCRLPRPLPVPPRRARPSTGASPRRTGTVATPTTAAVEFGRPSGKPEQARAGPDHQVAGQQDVRVREQSHGDVPGGPRADSGPGHQVRGEVGGAPFGVDDQ